MNNRLIIALFIVFMLIVLYSSLQSADTKQQTVVASPTPSAVISLPAVSATPVPPTPTLTPTLPPLQRPQFHVSGGGEAGDN